MSSRLAMAFVSVLTANGLCLSAVFGQVKGPVSTAPASGTTAPGSVTGSIPGTTSGGTRGTIPGTVGPSTNAPPPGPIYISGRVALEDGTVPPPGQVAIERVCNGNPRVEGYTDGRGYFRVQVNGQNPSVFQDASESGAGTYGGFGVDRGSGMGQSGMNGMGSDVALADCELRARFAGYRSQTVSLINRRELDDPNVGTILLHRMAASEGTTVSAISLAAPKDARKAFGKGQNAVKKQKLDDAAKEYAKAVELYPKYAVAWCELGKLQVRRNQADDARKSFRSAMEADPKFVEPYLRLSFLAAQTQQWQELADVSDLALKLDPFSNPHEFFFNAVAHFNLKEPEAAEKSAREAGRLDTRHEVPDSEHLLGVILAQRQDYAAAAEHLRAYLQYRPDARDAETVRGQLAQIEKLQADKR
jgi:tetratricopeptide (TPR) repeat protein